ncbi:hypothetical protein M409DRAFT_51788 [Zasmidium cellare ATCC 36951]|uniref:DNA replication checkpoint mediator MRC1 domain-containing protein n=1 Tax=Zasmidium cellare ATCC 36951 TaxID=1080233 RepID=A0A6A6CTH4_ZASCE|nr:uncharacterized protein M409DRAFT_51788 [Zasmidium cellare ATCC 36951]KAF2170013.1 hypothetical protein M409DRAFT_51788 [Zasmidium cellare ATCC 36951]
MASNMASSRMPFEEDDSPTPSPVKRQVTEVPSKILGSLAGTAADDEPSSSQPDPNEDPDEASDLDIRRPLGRAARRMLGGDETSSPRRDVRVQSASAKGQQSDEEDLYSATPRKEREFNPPSVPASEARSALFVSPARSAQDESDEDLPRNPLANSKLVALVAEKRKARIAREAEEEQQRRFDNRNTSDLPDELLGGSQEEDVNPDIERIMSDAAPPTRKASKKALLEMERETQRMSRQQALAHQMKVKRKFTTSDLFARLNYHPDGEQSGPTVRDGDISASSVPNSDSAESVLREPPSTPPSSPPTPLDRVRAQVDQGALSKQVPVREDSLTSLTDVDDEELPDMAQILSSSRAAPTKDGQRASEPVPKKGLKLARLGKKAMGVHNDESDDDLEIINDLPAHLRVFDKVKAVSNQKHHSTAIHTLKHLAHIGADAAPSRRKKGPSRISVNPQVLEAQLRMRAKEQARAQQLERIAELKAKGIEIQTTEEREREQEQYENLLEKARQEAVDLRKAEKAAAKGLGTEEARVLASDDESEDGDYTDASEDEDEQLGDAHDSNDLVDDVADESEDDEGEGEDEVEEEDELAQEEEQADEHESAQPTTQQKDEVSPFPLTTPQASRKPRKSHIIMDDEDESDAEVLQALPALDATEDDDPFAAFGFGAAKPASSLMSPTQAFNATMQTPTQLTQQDSMDVLNYLAPPTSSSLPSFGMHMDSQTQDESQGGVVPGSQVPESQQVNLLWETQAPETPVPGLHREGSNTTLETPGWQPTQDAGLPSPWQTMPGLRRENTMESIPEHDTQSTVRVRISESPAPQPARKRLIRGQRAVVDSSDDEEEPKSTVVSSKPAKKDAFREMARKRKEAMTAAEREEVEREMKQMMEEQAEESEDEYAGLGGDDFVAPETEQDREIIDSSHVDVDERQLAALFAERQRVADEAEAQKLYKDITTGGLRRKQANMFDLDEDEDDLAVRRRQMRQREEARKRKLLLQDDNIAGLAEGKHSKGKDAFLKAIADDDERDDDILELSNEDDNDASATQSDSQPSQQADDPIGPLRQLSGNKRRLEEAPEERRLAKERRTQASAFRAPASLAEVRESVSFLLDEPHAPTVGPTVLQSDSESDKEDAPTEEQQSVDDEDEVEEENNRQNDGGFASDRIAMPPPRLPASQRRTAAKPSVVDRLSLKRGSSASDSAHARTAWAAPANGGFKVPSLLRRATTNTALNANERGVSTSNGISKDNSSVKMGGTKKSSLAYQALAEERNKIVEASTKKRDENRVRIAKLRRAASSGFGKDMGGRFE